jgi:hypothetical protein
VPAPAARRNLDIDSAVFALAIGVALLLTPILWLHYFALLLVPLAVTAKRITLCWMLPLAYWLSPFTEPQVQPLWRLLFVFALLAAIVAIRPASPPKTRP